MLKKCIIAAMVASALLAGIFLGTVRAASDATTLRLFGNPSEFVGDGGALMTSYTYEVTSFGPPAPSHIELGLCVQRVAYVTTTSQMPLSWEPMGNAIKIETPAAPDRDTWLFSAVMTGTFQSLAPIWYTIKAGGTFYSDTTTGPVCTPNVIGHFAMSAGSLLPIDGRDMVGIGLILLLALGVGTAKYFSMKRGR